MLPAQDIVAASCFFAWKMAATVRPDEEVDLVQAVLVDDDGGALVRQPVDPAAGQLEALRGEIVDRRRDVESARRTTA